MPESLIRALVRALKEYEVRIGISFISFIFSTHVLSVQFEESSYIGVWQQAQKGESFTDTEICHFQASKEVECDITETGCDEETGFCEAHLYKASGTWQVSDNTLILSLSYFDKLIQSEFLIDEINLHQFNLVDKFGNKYRWVKCTGSQ